MNGRGPTTPGIGDLRSPCFLTGYKSWDDPPSTPPQIQRTEHVNLVGSDASALLLGNWGIPFLGDEFVFFFGRELIMNLNWISAGWLVCLKGFGIYMAVSKNRGLPENGWFFSGKSYFLMDDFGGPTPIFGNIHIFRRLVSSQNGIHSPWFHPLFFWRRTVVGYDDMTRHGIMFFLVTCYLQIRQSENTVEIYSLDR